MQRAMNYAALVALLVAVACLALSQPATAQRGQGRFGVPPVLRAKPVPADAVVAEVVPAQGVRAEVVAAEAAPAEGVPEQAVPIAAVPDVAAQTDAAQADRDPSGAQQADAERARLEEEFAKSLSGATLVGYYTTTGKEQQDGLQAEKYRLGTVKKLNDQDLWLFEYRYGDSDRVIPLPLLVKWAGDTPVITLTDLTIPGVGTFTARVLFYRGEYAGTWSAGDHGGQLFGRVEQQKPQPQEN